MKKSTPRAAKKSATSANASDSPTSFEWSVGLRVWVERRGEAVLGEGRADLLTAIDRTHSISAAARALGISYRHAWLMVQAANDAAGEALVESAVGGTRGGGARLTPRGRAAVSLFQELAAELRREAARSLGRIAGRAVATQRSLHLAAAISLQEAVGQILTEYALVHPTVRVHAVFGASNELAAQIAAGSPIDVFLTGDAAHVASPSRPLATNGLAVVAGAKTTVAAANLKALVQTDFERLAVADPACPLGQATVALCERLGVADRLRERTLTVENSRAVLAAVRSGRADVGIAFGSDAAQAHDLQRLFEIRAKQPAAHYYGAVVTQAGDAAEARQLLDFFTGAAARRCFRRCGLGA
jgi:molybdate transport system regulatory protein